MPPIPPERGSERARDAPILEKSEHRGEHGERERRQRRQEPDRADDDRQQDERRENPRHGRKPEAGSWQPELEAGS